MYRIGLQYGSIWWVLKTTKNPIKTFRIWMKR